MAATAATEFVKAVAALCKPGEAAVTFVYAKDGVSYCVATSETAHRVAADTAAGTDPVADDDTLLAVAVVSPDGTLTEYPLALNAK